MAVSIRALLVHYEAAKKQYMHCRAAKIRTGPTYEAAVAAYIKTGRELDEGVIELADAVDDYAAEPSPATYDVLITAVLAAHATDTEGTDDRA